MKILCLSDFHGAGSVPDEQPDLVILLGDIDYYEIRKIDAAYDCPKVGVLGNHDGPDYFEGTNVINLHQEVMEINGVTFAGFEGCPRYNKRGFLQYWEDEVQDFMDSLKKVDVFIAHSNPAYIEIEDTTDPHRGFMAFTNYMKTKCPHLFVHGHIHEQKQYTVGDTTVYSVYPHVVITI